MSHFRFKGTKDRAIARLMHLIPLLLARPLERAGLVDALAAALAESGWEGALPAIGRDEDPLPMLANDLALIRMLDLVSFLEERPYRTEPGSKLPLWATPTEAQALHLARLALDQLGLPHATVLDRLIRRLPAPVREAATTQAMTLSPTRSADAGLWETLQRGLAQGRQMRLTYQKSTPSEPETFVVDRGRLVWMTHAFYLVAYRPSYAAADGASPSWKYVREYRLDRIVGIEVLDAPVALAALPELTCVFVLAAELRERVFPLFDPTGRPTLKTEPLSDGTLRVQMQEISLLRARQRLASYGEHVLAVESPEVLRKELGRIAKILADRFADKGSSEEDLQKPGSRRP